MNTINSLEGLFYPVDKLIEEYFKMQMSTVCRNETGFILPYGLNPFAAAHMITSRVTDAKLTPRVLLVRNCDIDYDFFHMPNEECIYNKDKDCSDLDDKIMICLYGYDLEQISNIEKNEPKYIVPISKSGLNLRLQNETDEEREAREAEESLEKELNIVKYGQIIVKCLLEFPDDELNNKFITYFNNGYKKKDSRKIWNEFSEDGTLTEDNIKMLNCMIFRYISLLWKSYVRSYTNDINFFKELSNVPAMFRNAVDFTTPDAFEKYEKTGEIDKEHAYLIS